VALLHVERIGPDLWCLAGYSSELGTPLPTVVGTYSVVSEIATMLMTRIARLGAAQLPLFSAAERPPRPWIVDLGS
jgi:hypothetical protein